MKYKLEERLEIGKKIYNGEISQSDAMRLYDLTSTTVRNYMRLYRDSYGLPPKMPNQKIADITSAPEFPEMKDIEDYKEMSREQLIRELIQSKINEARLKKGYLAKGVGANKEYCPIESENTK